MFGLTLGSSFSLPRDHDERWVRTPNRAGPGERKLGNLQVGVLDERVIYLQVELQEPDWPVDARELRGLTVDAAAAWLAARGQSPVRHERVVGLLVLRPGAASLFFDEGDSLEAVALR